jgi:hypothetical protein
MTPKQEQLFEILGNDDNRFNGVKTIWEKYGSLGLSRDTGNVAVTYYTKNDYSIKQIVMPRDEYNEILPEINFMREL